MTEFEIGYRQGYEQAIKELYYVISQSCQDLLASPTDTNEYRSRELISQIRVLKREMKND